MTRSLSTHGPLGNIIILPLATEPFLSPTPSGAGLCLWRLHPGWRWCAEAGYSIWSRESPAPCMASEVQTGMLCPAERGPPSPLPSSTSPGAECSPSTAPQGGAAESVAGLGVGYTGGVSGGGARGRTLRRMVPVPARTAQRWLSGERSCLPTGSHIWAPTQRTEI